MNDAQLSIQSLDAVDIRLDVAGAGSRAYAFLIDWHIRLLAAIVIGVAASALAQMLMSSGADASWIDDSFYGLIAAGAIYFLYHPVLEIAMRGLTPGKRWAGLRIVGRDGAPVSTASLLVRNLFRLVDSLPAFYALGLTTMLVSKHSLRLGDMAAGTLVVHDGVPRGQLDTAARLSSSLQPGAQQLLEEWLARWNELDLATRDEIARRTLIREGLGAQIEGLSDDGLRKHVGNLVNA